MTPGKLSDEALIGIMLENAQYVQETAAQAGRDEFFNDRTIRQALIYSLQSLGQAANGLSGEVKSFEKEIPWRKIIGFRNVLVHEYFRVDLHTTWEIIENNVPVLLDALRRMNERVAGQAHTLER